MGESTDLKYHSFYFKDFYNSEQVRDLTTEQVGAYIMVLILQMNNKTQKSIPADPAKICRVIAWHDLDEEYFLANIWPAISQFFVPHPTQPDRLYNVKLAERVEFDLKKYNSKKEGGYKSVQTRAANANAAIARGGDDAKKLYAFDFSPLLALYPRRDDKTGWGKGLQIMGDTITTKEDFELLKRAIIRYKAVIANQSGSKKILRLDNFMTEWAGFLTNEDRKAVAAMDLDKPEEIKQADVATTSEVPVERDRLKELGPGIKPPWQAGRYDPPSEQVYLDKLWSEEDRLRWRRGEEFSLKEKAKALMAEMKATAEAAKETN